MEQGTVLSGRYRLRRRLGRGGMGAVWVAQDEDLDRPVAVKIVLAGLDGDPRSLVRLRKEAAPPPGSSTWAPRRPTSAPACPPHSTTSSSVCWPRTPPPGPRPCAR
ncbi:hypothetical protein [Actinomadura nitritigenes]|uniref:hypothetical protein n=1 Tax=Actinomadura nitritigenes TaxID=134602 RepID=UPI003D8AC8A3